MAENTLRISHAIPSLSTLYAMLPKTTHKRHSLTKDIYNFEKKFMTKKFISLTLTIFIISLVYSKEMFVTGSSVNVRTDDNSNSQIISKLNLNDKVEVLEIQGDWAKIEINGENGYVKQQYLSENITKTDTNKTDTKENKGFLYYLKIFGIGVLLAYAFYYSYKKKKSLL